MSAAKVIFTYKRKRLSSCSGVGHADVCSDISSDIQAGKHQAAAKESSDGTDKELLISGSVKRNDVERTMDYKSCLDLSNDQGAESNLQHICHGKELSAYSSPRLFNSSIVKEEYHVRSSSAPNSREMELDSIELSENNTDKASGEQIFPGPPLGETPSSIDEYVQDGSGSQSVEDPDSLSKQYGLNNDEVAKGKLTAPLLTFSRRLKRKADISGAVISGELPLKERAAAIREKKSMSVSSCSCEAALNDRTSCKRHIDVTVTSNDIDMRNVCCQSKDKIINKEVGESSCPCERSCAETSVLKNTEDKSNCQGIFAVDTSPITEQSTIELSGPAAFAFSGPNALQATSLLKDTVECSLNNRDLCPSCDVDGKTDDQCVPYQSRASSGDSQLTSTDCSDMKIGAGNTTQQKTSSGAFVIDCNAIPESDLQEEASDFTQDSKGVIKNHGKFMEDESLKSKGLDLFADADLQAVESPSNRPMRLPNDVRTSSSEPKTKYLQLFSEDAQSGLSAPAGTNSEIGCSKAQQSATFTLDSKRGSLEQCSSKAPIISGLTLPTEPIFESQTSKPGSSVHLFQDPNVRIRECIQNPVVQSFPDQTSLFLRHKVLLESSNSRATALRGNRNISLDRFESGPIIWSEEELDSLWIGIRRHGKGNWHAMLLDPRLRFAPWRVARDLADQWEREEYKLVNGQHMAAGGIPKSPDPYNLDYYGRFPYPGAGVPRENVSAETPLSLGDAYAQKEGRYFRNNLQSYGIGPPHKHVTIASCRVENYSCGSFSNVQTSVMIRSDASPDGAAMGLATNNRVPHWLRDSNGTPSRLFEPLPPHMSALTQTGGHQFVHPFPEPSSTFCGRRNQISNMFPGAMAGEVQPSSGSHYGGPLKRKQNRADKLIVIDSDNSSEETISDDNNVRS